jgi:hypothetical protein
MIWWRSLTVLNMTFGPWLSGSSPVLRTFVLATIAVPVVVYGLMPLLHRIRATIFTRRAGGAIPTVPQLPLDFHDATLGTSVLSKRGG